MSTPIPPEPPTESADRPRSGRRWYRRRPRGRAAVIGAALLALLVVGGVAAALLVPGGDRGDRGRSHGGGPELALTSEFGTLSGTDELDGSLEPGDGPGRGDREGRWGRGLGDDTLLVGTVASTTADSIVVTPDSGPARTVRTDTDTRVRGIGNAALGDLQPGERVVVRVEGTGDAATAEAVWSPRTRVAGTVTAVAGGTATVTALDGRTVAVDVSRVTAPAVGDLVAVGGVTTDGSTLTADAIRVLPKAS